MRHFFILGLQAKPNVESSRVLIRTPIVSLYASFVCPPPPLIGRHTPHTPIWTHSSLAAQAGALGSSVDFVFDGTADKMAVEREECVQRMEAHTFLILARATEVCWCAVWVSRCSCVWGCLGVCGCVGVGVCGCVGGSCWLRTMAVNA
jgi:hypothetical protein